MLVFATVFFIAVALQVLFFTLFLIGFTRKREAGKETPPVSVIICAHDEAENLATLVPLLMEQDYPDFEVIIVNDRSNDETFDFLLAETKRNPRVKMVQVDRLPAHVNGKKYALTLGIKAAKNEVIVLTDADCRPSSMTWIRSMAAEFRPETTFAIGYSPYQVLPGFLNKFIRFEALVTAVQYVGFALLKRPYCGVGRNLAYRKSFFLGKKGFNHLLHITGGDDDLFVNQYATSANTMAVVGASSLVYSIPQNTIGSFIRQKIRHLSVGKYYNWKDRLWLAGFATSWLAFWFAGLPLIPIAATDIVLYYLLGAMALRLILVVVTVHVASKRLGAPFEVWPVVILDFLYSIYYISTGVMTLVTKQVRWKN